MSPALQTIWDEARSIRAELAAMRLRASNCYWRAGLEPAEVDARSRSLRLRLAKIYDDMPSS